MSVPMKQVISGAFDTLSHAMETYFGKPDENNLSDDLSEAVMRSVIRNTRILLTDQKNYEARSELAWASAMAENGILKIGKTTDFRAIADSTVLTAGCCKKLTHDEIYYILCECK